MRMQKIIILAIFCCFTTSFCFAGNSPGATTVNLSGAYYHFASKRDLDDTSMPNIALDYNFNEHWAIEGSIGVINTNLRSTSQGVHGFLYMIDGLYRFKPYKCVEPYVLAGIGLLGFKTNSNNDNQHQGNM